MCLYRQLDKDQKDKDLAMCNSVALAKSSASHAEPLFGLSLSNIVSVS